jgi:2-hydroxy-4-(methylsulfanyl)butanoate S-methyltransferase
LGVCRGALSLDACGEYSCGLDELRSGGPSLEPLSDVRDVSRLAYGFMASKALFAALNLDLFSRLEEPRTLDDLAHELGIARNRLKTLLVTLTALGLIVRDDAAFQNSPASARYLVRGARAYFGDYYRLQIDRQIYPSLERLNSGLAGDTDNLALYGDAGLTSDPAEAEAFSLAQHAGSLGPALELAKTVDLSGTSKLLDVAGGSGTFSIALCNRYPEMSATIIDFPNVIEVAQRYVADAGLSDRIRLRGENALDAPWPENQDVVLLSYLLSAVKQRDIPTLLEHSYRSLRPGGRLIVHDFMLDDDEQGPALAAQWFLSYLASEPDATSFSAATLTELVLAKGFVNPSSQVLISEITKTLICEKPS